jgi:hypothetical protein
MIVEKSKIGQGKGFFPKDKSDNRPHITLIMQLGLQTKATKSTLPAHIPARSDKGQMSTKHVYKIPSKISMWERKPSRASSRHPCYAIPVTGCSGSMYNIVKNKDQYAFLLGGRDILDEHPQQHPASLAAVHQFKPFWAPGLDCYDWIEDPELNGNVVPEEEEDRLLVGADAVSVGIVDPDFEMVDSSDIEIDQDIMMADPFLSTWCQTCNHVRVMYPLVLP